ncbi:MAG: hypothetical protein KY476_08815 [Planctomycetes bacterium]|nr:hypothetical protein [Planctomycetota bacterium]
MSQVQTQPLAGDATIVGRRVFLRSACVALVLACSTATGSHAGEWAFDVQFTSAVRDEPFSGRVYLFFSRREAEPRLGPNWFQPETFFARDVKDWRPDTPLRFSSDADEGVRARAGEAGDAGAGGRLKPATTSRMLSYPGAPQTFDPVGYRVQAVARFNPLERTIGTGAGNGFSAAVKVGADSSAQPLVLTIDRLVPPPMPEETRWTKLLEVPSEALSRFHGRPVSLRAAVTLPASYYDAPERRYPVMFIIPGFSGSYTEAISEKPVEEDNAGGVEFLRVTLEPGCPLGHHVFADSANNGPVGTSLVTEFLPEFDRHFRTVPQPTGRFLTGHSSGGWSSLWLQVTHPETFGGVWSTAPDPVDFRDWQQVDLYRNGANVYVDDEGNERPIARRGGKPALWYREFARMEWVLGHGGQLHSFEAVFSPRGDDGKPRLMFDRETGAVDPAVARAWQEYDIRLVLERNWRTLGPKLAGKLHIFMGDADTFYLEGATKRLKASLEELGSDAVVEIHAGKDHGTLLSPALRNRIRREMTAAFLAAHPEHAAAARLSMPSDRIGPASVEGSAAGERSGEMTVGTGVPKLGGLLTARRLWHPPPSRPR